MEQPSVSASLHLHDEVCEDDGDGELELLDEPALVEGEADGGHVVDDDEAGQLQHRGPEVGRLQLGLNQARYSLVVDETFIYQPQSLSLTKS